MSDSVLYLKNHMAPDAFQEAIDALLARGFHVSAVPSESREGVVARLKKEGEEIWIEWMDDDSLSISATRLPSEHLKTEISQTLERANLKESRVI